MDFYLNWEKNLSNIKGNEKYVKAFLKKDEESLKVFENGLDEELLFVCKLLLKIPISTFIYNIDEDQACTADTVIQYSNLYHAVVNVSRILKFTNQSMTFTLLGKEIIRAKTDSACRKYGENHAKLAHELSMVKFTKAKGTLTTNTAFGNFSVNLSDKDRLEIARRLLLRNQFIQKIIFLAKKGKVNYMEIACRILSKSTAERRKSNMKQLINLILNKNEIAKNIVW